MVWSDCPGQQSVTVVCMQATGMQESKVTTVWSPAPKGAVILESQGHPSDLDVNYSDFWGCAALSPVWSKMGLSKLIAAGCPFIKVRDMSSKEFPIWRTWPPEIHGNTPTSSLSRGFGCKEATAGPLLMDKDRRQTCTVSPEHSQPKLFDVCLIHYVSVDFHFRFFALLLIWLISISMWIREKWVRL